jgi:hypothetical protein
MSSEENAANLKKLGFLTRIPGTLKLVTHVIAQALRWDTWHSLDETTHYQAIELCHYGMAGLDHGVGHPAACTCRMRRDDVIPRPGRTAPARESGAVYAHGPVYPPNPRRPAPESAGPICTQSAG